MNDPVSVERYGQHVLVIKLNRPEARNAVNAEMTQTIGRAVEAAQDDPAIRVGVLTAEGDVFCAGADLKVVASGRAADLTYGDKGFAGLIRANSRFPWIAAVSGLALGGGTELSLACDMIVASENAQFGLPEVKRGIFAGAGGIFRLPRSIPRAIALEMICTGEPISAARAYELGLVNYLTPEGGALEQALGLAGKVAAAAPVAVRESLATARLAYDLAEDDLWVRSREIGRTIAQTEDFKEGPRAFAEKRAPVWKGC